MGAEAFENVKRASVQAVIVTVVTGIGVGVLTLAVSPILPTWMGVDPAIKKDASLYFAIICLPMLFRSAIIIFGALLRAVGDTKTPMYVNVCMNLVNIVLNYLFIYDTRMIKIGGASVKMFGFGYGAVGAGIGTAVSFVVGGIFMTIALYKNPDMYLRRDVKSDRSGKLWNLVFALDFRLRWNVWLPVLVMSCLHRL